MNEVRVRDPLRDRATQTLNRAQSRTASMIHYVIRKSSHPDDGRPGPALGYGR